LSELSAKEDIFYATRSGIWVVAAKEFADIHSSSAIFCRYWSCPRCCRWSSSMHPFPTNVASLWLYLQRPIYNSWSNLWTMYSCSRHLLIQSSHFGRASLGSWTRNCKWFDREDCTIVCGGPLLTI
jgi:hypothetical protein